MQNKPITLALFFLVIIFVLGISQLSSFLVIEKLAIGETYIVNSFIHFTHIRNTGGIFGSFDGQGNIIAFFSSILLIGLICYLLFDKSTRLFEYICFGFVIGAGFSNILDRILYGSVIDFINVQHIPYWNYIFNTADSMIHVGVWPLLCYTLFIKKDGQEKES